MTNTILSDLTQDVKNLYLKTSVREIEDQFIILSAANVSEIGRWLKGPVSDRVSLQDPAVLNAIRFLEELRKKYPTKVSSSEMSFYFVNNPKSATDLSYLMAFSKVLGMPGTEILTPYNDIIKSTGHFTGGLDLDPETILSDLQILQEDLTGQVEQQTKVREPSRPAADWSAGTKKQQQSAMFGHLLRTFSEEIASAADTNGLDGLADVIRNGALARTPNVGIGKYISQPSLNDRQWKLVFNLVSRIEKYPDSKLQNHYHDLVEMSLLTATDQLTPEDMMRFVDKVEESKDFSSYMEGNDGDDASYDVDHGVEILNDQRLNPSYLYLLNGLLSIMYRGIDPR